MSLENLVKTRQLQPHQPTAEEIARLLDAADRSLRDAGVKAVSIENRFDAAYKTLMQTARAVLLAHGYRPSTSVPGHHQVVIQVLPITLGISADRIAVLDALRKQRNIADYTGEGVTDESLNSCIEEAKRLRAEVEAWFKKNKSELRKL